MSPEDGGSSDGERFLGEGLGASSGSLRLFDCGTSAGAAFLTGLGLGSGEGSKITGRCLVRDNKGEAEDEAAEGEKGSGPSPLITLSPHNFQRPRA